MAGTDDGRPRGRTYWHRGFYLLVAERSPPTTRVQTEQELSQQPSRADLILLRRHERKARDHEATVLRRLWPLLSDVAVVDFKSPTRGFRRFDLLRLLRYGMEYHERHHRDLAGPQSLTRVLIVPQINRPLREEAAMLGCRLQPISEGYTCLTGKVVYATYVVDIERAARAERDEYLEIFTRRRVTDSGALQWMQRWIGRDTMQRDPKDMAGYDEVIDKLVASLPLEEILTRLAPEQRLAGLSPEQRLAGLAPDTLVRVLRAPAATGQEGDSRRNRRFLAA